MSDRITFQTLQEETIQRRVGGLAIEYFSEGEKYAVTGDAYVKHIQCMANYLAVELKDLETGSWVALKSPNSVYWFGVMFALMKCGFHVMLVDDKSNDMLNAHFVREAGLKAFVSDRPVHLSGVRDLLISEVEQISNDAILSDSITYPMIGDDRWSDKISFHTSGTTGTAKAYVFSAESIINTVRNVAAYWSGNEKINARKFDSDEPHKSILALPFRHISGFLLVVTFWYLGNTVVFPPNDGVFSIIDTCKKENIWMMFCVPAMWKGFIRIAMARYGSSDQEAFRQMFGENLRVGISAGAKLDAESVKVLLNSGIYFLNSWGMTEVGTSTMGGIDEDESPDYVGGFYNKHRVKILREDGTYVDEGVGEMVLEGHSLYESVFSGGKEIPREGPLRSGDIFRLENGRVYFLGRCKSVIVTDSGENIYPEELDVIFDFLNDETSGYCVAGYEDQVTMFLSPNEFEDFESSPCFEKICSVNAGLPMNKKLSRLYVMKDPLPRTGKGEVARFRMPTEVKERSEGVVCVSMKGRKRAK